METSSESTPEPSYEPKEIVAYDLVNEISKPGMSCNRASVLPPGLSTYDLHSRAVDIRRQLKALEVPAPSRGSETLLHAAIGWERFYVGRVLVWGAVTCLYIGISELIHAAIAADSDDLKRVHTYALSWLPMSALVWIWFEWFGCCSRTTRVWWAIFPEAYHRLGFYFGPVSFSVVVPPLPVTGTSDSDDEKPRVVVSSPPLGTLGGAVVGSMMWFLRFFTCRRMCNNLTGWLLDDVKSVAVFQETDGHFWEVSTCARKKADEYCPCYYFRHKEETPVQRPIFDNEGIVMENGSALGPVCVCLPPPACANKEKGSGLCYDNGTVLNTGAGSETWWRLGMVLSNTTITATEPTVWLSRKTCNAQEIRELFVLRGKMEDLLRTYNETTIESRQQLQADDALAGADMNNPSTAV